MNMRMILLAGAMTAALAGCKQSTITSSSGSSRTQTEAQDNAYAQITANQPAPAFNYSLPRALIIKLYEFEQRAAVTWSVVQSPYTGKILFQCESRGYPIPASTQLTNPEKIISGLNMNDLPSHAAVTIPQQEPNGLFSPPETAGTWIFCVAQNGQLAPVYEEPNVQVFPFPVVENNGTLTRAPGSKAANTIDIAGAKPVKGAR